MLLLRNTSLVSQLKRVIPLQHHAMNVMTCDSEEAKNLKLIHPLIRLSLRYHLEHMLS